MKIGLTGGIGCGKSETLKCLAKRGCQVASCDAWIHELLTNDLDIRRAIEGRWGMEVFHEGSIDRKKIAAIVFNNPTELLWLEGELHPKVRALWKAFLVAKKELLCVVEVPLLFEKQLVEDFDITLCVAASYQTQLNRLQKIGLSELQAKRRIERQMPLSEKIERADFVLHNEFTLSTLEEQIDILLNKPPFI